MKVHLILALIVAICGCENSYNQESSDNIMSETNTLPYRASSEKIAKIKAGLAGLKIGDNKSKVIELMGEPDEIGDHWHRSDKGPRLLGKPKPIGEIFLYILARDKKSGSEVVKNESIAYVLLSTEGKVSGFHTKGEIFGSDQINE